METSCFSSRIGRVNIFGRMVSLQKGLDDLFTWYMAQNVKISVILISCDVDMSKTRLDKFRWRCYMMYSKCQSHKVLLLKKDVQQKGKDVQPFCWTSTPKEKIYFQYEIKLKRDVLWTTLSYFSLFIGKLVHDYLFTTG